MITLHPSNATQFSSQGFGSLRDFVTGRVTEELNGIYELALEYPVSGVNYNELQLRRIIYCKPTPYSDPQPFRIYSISKPINRVVMVNAAHISYDLVGYPVNEFKATSAKEVMTKLKANSQVAHPFTFNSTVTSTGTVNVEAPRSIRNVLGNNVLSAYSGEFEFDNFMVYHHETRGMDRGLNIRYGRNLIDITQEENISNVYTGVYPYWVGTIDDNTVMAKLPERIINVDGTFDFVRILPLDASGEFSGGPPTADQLRTYAQSYIKTEKIGVPKVSLELSSVQIPGVIDKILLGDTVQIEFIEAGIDASAKCVKTVYDLAKDRYDSVGFGEGVSNLATAINETNKHVDDKIEQQKVHFDAEIGNIKIDYAEIELAIIEKADIDWVNANFAHIVNGYIDVAEIGDATIGTAKIADAAITVAKIEEAFIEKLVAVQGKFESAEIGELTADNISAEAITTVKIDAEAVTAEKIAAGAITTDKIEASAVTADKIEAGAITTDKIDAGAVTTEKLDADSVTADKIMAGSIETDKIDAGAVTAEKIAAGAITTDKIEAEAVTADKISANAITTDKIEAGSITADKIDAGTITADHINSNTIAAIGITASDITADKIASGEIKVGDANIVDGTISGAKISAASITNAQISDAFIADAYIEELVADKIKGGTLDASEMTVTNLKANSITVGQINGQQIASGELGWDHLDDLLSGDLEDLEVDVDKALADAGLALEKVEGTTKTIVTEFAQSTSRTTPPTTGWSTSSPTWVEGKYIWTRNKTIQNDSAGTVIYSSPVCISGATGAKGDTGLRGLQGEQGDQGIAGPKGDKGDDGTNGVDGKTTYFHIKYSSVSKPTSSSQMTETPNTYIGTYVDFTSTDSTDPNAYTWSRFEGAQGANGTNGIPGKNGSDGKTSYLHIKYSNNGTSFTGNGGEDVGDYIGQYTDYTSADSTNFGAYKWSKIKGATGATGATGGKGDKGDEGSTGNGIHSMVAEYYVSTSKTTQTGGSWSTTSPTWSKDKYVWTRIKTVFTNGDTDYTTPMCDSSWEAVNEIEAGSRNLLLDTGVADAHVSSHIGGGRSSFTTVDEENAYGGKALKIDVYDVTTGQAGRYRTGLYLTFGKTYTWRVVAKGVGTFTVGHEQGGTQNIDLTNEFKVYSNTFVANPSSRHQFIFYAWTQGNSTITLYDMMLVEGNVVPSYSPAPEDLENKIEEVVSIANGKSTAYYSPSAPSASGKKENDIWFDTDGGYKMYYFKSGAWYPTQFDTQAIAAEAITADQIQGRTITAGKIATGTLTANEIAALTITGDKIRANTIVAGKLAADSVMAGNIAANAVTAKNIVSESIDATKLDTEELFVGGNAFINKLKAVDIDAAQITTGKISSERLDINGLVAFEALDDDLQHVFNVQGDKTYINGGMIATNTINADKINLKSGLTVQGNDGSNTFAISEEGEVFVNGTLQSGNFSEQESLGYKITPDGNAVFNQARINGEVLLPNAGITDYGATKGNINILNNTSDLDKPYTTNQYTQNFDSGLTSEFSTLYGINTGTKTTLRAYIKAQKYMVADSRNLKPATIHTGYLRKDGTAISNSSYWRYTDYIFITPNTKYTMNGFTELGVDAATCFYDASKNFISGIPNDGVNRSELFTTPANAAYMRCSFCVTDINTIKIGVAYGASIRISIYNAANAATKYIFGNTIQCGEEGYSTVSFDWLADSKSYIASIGNRSEVAGSECIGMYSKPKLEVGSVATPWCANPKDSFDFTRIWAGASFEQRDGAPFRVSQSGNVFASNVDLSGILRGTLDSGDVQVYGNALTIHAPGTETEKVRIEAGQTLLNNDVVFGSTSDKRFEYLNSDRVLTLNTTNLSIRGAGLTSLFFDAKTNGGAFNGLNLIAKSGGGHHVLRHSIASANLGTLIFDSEGTAGNAGDFRFIRKNSTEDVKVKIDGHLSIDKTIQSDNSSIEMRATTDGWAFYSK